MFEDAYAPWFVNLYFISCVVICSFFLLNLTIAVMLMKYQELDKVQQQKSKLNEDLKRAGEEIKLPMPLIEWLIKNEQIQITDYSDV